MKNAILVDLDGTLANIDHRKHFIENSPKNWDGFNANAKYDKVNKWCYELCYAMNSGSMEYSTIIVTGRSEEMIDETKYWLSKNRLFPYLLFMRKKGDKREDFIVKKEIYDEHILGKYNVLFVLEDRKRVVDMWRRLGLVCLQCAEGDY